jgi:hypothetical protein
MAKMGVNIAEKAQLIRLEINPKTSNKTIATVDDFGSLDIFINSFSIWGAFAAAPQHITIKDIWKAKAIISHNPLYQLRTIFSGPVPVKARPKTNTIRLKITQNTNESGIILSAANWNFLDILHNILITPSTLNFLCVKF